MLNNKQPQNISSLPQRTLFFFIYLQVSWELIDLDWGCLASFVDVVWTHSSICELAGGSVDQGWLIGTAWQGVSAPHVHLLLGLVVKPRHELLTMMPETQECKQNHSGHFKASAGTGLISLPSHSSIGQSKSYFLVWVTAELDSKRYWYTGVDVKNWG